MNDEGTSRRVGIIIFTHADYGRALMSSAEGILGVQDGYEILSVGNNVDVEAIMTSLRNAAERLDNGGGVVVFTDMFGGTPSNLAISLLGSRNVEVLSGVNLPMLLRALSRRGESLVDMAREAHEAGVQGIVAAGEILRQKSKDG